MRTLCVLCAAGLVLGPEPSEAVLAEASERWNSGDMEGVIEVFERATAEDPHPDYLFGRARAEVRLGRCEDAVKHLEAFLDFEPPEAARDATIAELEKCGVSPPAVDPEPQPEPPQASSVPPPEAFSPPPTDALADAPARRPTDAAGWSMVGAGGALLVVGVTLFAVGASRVARPGATVDEQAYRERTQSSQRLGWSGLGLGGVGGLVLAGGVARLVWHARTAQR